MVMSVNSKMTAIADAIRAKSGKSDLLTLDNMASEIQNLSAEEIIQHADIPDYVKAEALRVANLVEAERKSDSIVFLAMSDNHYGDNGQTDIGDRHGAMAAKILAYALKVDFMTQLGDISRGHASNDTATVKQQIANYMKYLHESHQGIPCFHAIGNHDTGIYYHDQQIEDGKTGVFTVPGDWLYNNFTALSASDSTVISGQANGGYCYRDFASKKLRVFLLNTSEALVANQQDKATFGSQRKWLADALVNLNSKSDASSWSFIILSHYPADYGNTMPLSELLKAYVQGSSISITLESGSSTSVSFSGKNSAKMIAQFHGHVHNFLTSKLYSYATGKGAQYDAWRVCIPNGQYGRENYYTTVDSYTDISFADSVTYSKTAGTAKDTSFVVNIITPSEQKIASVCYGAGVNRVVSYAAATYYSVSTSLTNVTISGEAASVEEGQPYTATLSIASNYEWKSVKITMGGTDVTSSVYSNGTISIPAVTGNVVITASATEKVNYTNQIPISTDASGAVYNAPYGYKTGLYLNKGNETSHSKTGVTGFIPCKGNAKSTIYFKNVGFNANSSTYNYERVSIYDSNKNYLTQFKASNTGNAYQPVLDNGELVSFQIRATTAGVSTTGDLFIRVSGSTIGENSIITVDQPIE